MNQISIETAKGADKTTYWRIDPSGKKPPRQITERQWNRDQVFVTFIQHADLGRNSQ